MLARKIFVCTGLFLCVLFAGGLADHLIVKQRMTEFLTPGNESFTIYSSRLPTHSADFFSPFLPREYVRIIRQNRYYDIVPIETR